MHFQVGVALLIFAISRLCVGIHALRRQSPLPKRLVILTQPQRVKPVAPGTVVTLSVTVSNTSPFAYSLPFDGTNLSNNFIRTIAGSGSMAFTGDGGQATNAGLSWPQSVALDASGNLYIADYGHDRIRVINSNGVISTVVGNGGRGLIGDGGPAVDASLYWPTWIVPSFGTLLH